VQRLHPDRLAGATAAERALAERRTREVNEAWRVLQDPARRRAYDQARLAGSGRPPGATSGASGRSSTGTDPSAARAAPSPIAPDPDDDLIDVGPPPGPVGWVLRHLPSVVVLLVLALIFVLSAYAGGGPASDRDGATTPTTTPPIVAGSCLDIAPGPIVTQVPCSGPFDVRVVDRVAPGAPCPDGSEPRRLSSDGQTDCVVPA
jgi:hypothetical protein